MGSLTQAGKKSKTAIWLHESHKLHVEFQVAAGQTVYRGQPVKLTNDGKITPWAKADLNHLIIGYVTTDQIAGEWATVAMKGYMGVLALNATAGAMNCGPVTYQAYNTANGDTTHGNKGYSTYAAPTTDTGNTETHAWSIDQAAAQYDLIRVIVN